MHSMFSSPQEPGLGLEMAIIRAYLKIKTSEPVTYRGYSRRNQEQVCHSVLADTMTPKTLLLAWPCQTTP